MLPTAVMLLLAGPGLEEPPPAAANPQPGPGQESPRPGQLGEDLAARAGPDELSFDALHEVIIWRHGLSPSGRAALRQLLELQVLDALAREHDLQVTSTQLTRRWSKLDGEIRQSGTEGGLPSYLEANAIGRDEFLEYLRLAIVHEVLTRQALGLPEHAAVSGEQQTAWLESVLEERGYEELPHPWRDGVVARSGTLEIERGDYARHLRGMLPEEELREACHQLLLLQRALAKMPDLAPSALQEEVETDLARRRALADADPLYKGISYERLLEAQGLSLQAMRRDPAPQLTALSAIWIRRTHGDQSLREVYSRERADFDGIFGEGVNTHVLVLKAALLPNDLVPRTFEQANEELEAMRTEITGLDDFKRLAARRSEDPATREKLGFLGIVTRGAPGVPEVVRERIFAELDAARSAGISDVSGTILGPLRISSGALLVALGERRPAPTWEQMSAHIESELKRRFLNELLPAGSVVTWIDAR